MSKTGTATKNTSKAWFIKLKIGTFEFDTQNNCYIMGILNVTPDSFSDGGKYCDTDRALRHAEEMIRQGCAIIDVGGESTRPGYTQISEEEEIERTAPIIEKIKSEFNIPISIDTYKSRVAEAGLIAGADLINDIWGLKYDDHMGDVIARYDAACCLMHNRQDILEVSSDSPDPDLFMRTVLSELRECVDIALKAGISADRIILDPGVGFAKTREQNLEVMAKMHLIRELGYPVLLGASRKSVIGLTLDLPKEERLEGTIATTVTAVLEGCSFVRVHDVKENYRAMKMAQAIHEYRWNQMQPQ